MTRVPRHLLFGQLLFIFSWFSCSSFSWLGPPRLRQPLTSFPWPPLHSALWCPVGAASVGTAKGSTLYTQSQILLFGWGGWKEFYLEGVDLWRKPSLPPSSSWPIKQTFPGLFEAKEGFLLVVVFLPFLAPSHRERHGVPPCSDDEGWVLPGLLLGGGNVWRVACTGGLLHLSLLIGWLHSKRMRQARILYTAGGEWVVSVCSVGLSSWVCE